MFQRHGILKNGWYKTKDGFPLCSSHARRFVDVLKNHTIEWPYRTTVGYRDGPGWQVIELCQSVFQLDEREAPLDAGYKKLITLLSKKIISLVDVPLFAAHSSRNFLPWLTKTRP